MGSCFCVFSSFPGPQIWAQERADSPRPEADSPESHLLNTLSPSTPDSTEDSEQHISTYTHACINATLPPYPGEHSIQQKYNACKPNTPSPFPSKHRTTAKESRVGMRPAHLPSSVMPWELWEPRTAAGGAGSSAPSFCPCPRQGFRTPSPASQETMPLRIPALFCRGHNYRLSILHNTSLVHNNPLR